ncbi:MAG: SsrA-binding protein [Chlamydiia bacterium]|nr:SsrA-binding protein [Chlamydiia bacterium]MCH9615585.1 SsrA-binding protein [Chlamydiia bacterium]MCH9629240.1 SsrA-binding protein [Chlamydiia bacterium]
MDLVQNRRARHDYEILETLEAGIVLLGTEIKSLRDHGGILQDAFVKITGNEAFLMGATIAQYKFGNIHNHEEKRDRKLLLHKNEIVRLKHAVQLKGHTLIPLSLYLKKGYCKVKIGVAKGKKLHDKRQDLKKRDAQRDIERHMK